MFEDIKILFYFGLYFLIIGTPLYLIYKLRAIIRAIKMKNIAKKFNLDYKKSNKGPLFESVYSGKRKINIINGKINGKNIIIYDYLIFGPFRHIVIHIHHTVFISDISKKDKTGFFRGFFRVSTKQIVNFLKECENKK